MKRLLAPVAFMAMLVACSDDSLGNPPENSTTSDTSSSYVNSPSDLTVTRSGNTSVILSWTDNSDNETGFGIWLRLASDASTREQIATVDADVTEYSIEDGLEIGVNYYFGVQALGEENSSTVVYVLYKMEDLGDPPSVAITSTVDATAACFGLSYQITDSDDYTILSYGLCWNTSGDPTIDDDLQYGPELPDDGEVYQVIPNAVLDHDTEYYIRAFVSASEGTWYSSSVSATLDDEPEAITLDWTKLEFSDLPSTIEVYQTTSSLNGDNFRAWYAITDPDEVDFRVNLPSSAATIDDQASSFDGECYVMVNGGYFYNGSNTGVCITESTQSGSISSVRGSLLSTDTEEYSSMYYVTRGIFGVDSSDNPAVYWVGTDASSSAYYFDRPLPSVKGEAKYSIVSSTNPTDALSWSPKYAQSAGPVLLIDGKIPFDFTTTSNGDDYYMSNYEIIAYDIFGTDVTPDRTAAGYTSDGKVILFVCDGRITDSDGATLLELAQLMKGLDCVGAVNFDGGGSTGIVVCGEHLNDTSSGNRSVVSTLGFFKK